MNKPLKDSFPSNDNGNGQGKGALLKNNVWDASLDTHLKSYSLDQLPQAQVLSSCLGHLVKEQSIEEAYLRGSFSTGVADHYSDIDLFIVVSPDQIEETYKAFRDFLEQRSTVIVSCHDTIAPDFGGIGFVTLFQDNQQNIYQYDLYMAIKGVPPKEELAGVPRIYSRDSSYNWLEDKQNASQNLDCVSDFITKHKDVSKDEDKMKLFMSDLMIVLFMMKKHLDRGQTARAINDNNQILSSCIDMLCTTVNDFSYQSPLYKADRVIAECEQNSDKTIRDVATSLKKELNEPVSYQKIANLFAIGETLLANYYPDVYVDMKPSMDKYKQNISASKKLVIQKPNLGHSPNAKM